MRGSREPLAASTARSFRTEWPQAMQLGALLLLGVFAVVRTLIIQPHYSGEAAFTGMIAVMWAVLTAGAAWSASVPLRIPEPLLLAVALWLGVHTAGVLRAPNLGTAIPLATDALLHTLVLLGGFFLCRANSRIVPAVCRVVLGVVALEALVGLWQYFIDFPRMWHDVRTGADVLPEALQGSMGQARFYGDNIFGTFVNPNLLAAFLVLGIWIAAGVIAAGNRREKAFSPRRLLGLLLTGLLLLALYLTSSKGAWAACAAGGWFFAAQWLSARCPERRRLLRTATFVLAGGTAAVLALGLAGVFGPNPFGASMQVRFEYWKAALGMGASQPLLGTGLGGFAEHYTHFKTPLGTEVKEAHNDYLQLWAELGIAAVLCYGVLWRVILRSRSEAEEGAPVLFVPEERGHSKKAAMVLCAGGVLGLVFLCGAFRAFSTNDALALLSGKLDGDTVRGALQVLMLPLLFAVCVMGLREPDSGSEAGTGERSVPPALLYGLRAGLGAVLLHQLVDFDLRAQPLMSALFLLGGMLYAAQHAGHHAPGEAPPVLSGSVRGRRQVLLLPALAILFIPTGVWLPLAAGIPRTNADALEEDAGELLRGTPDRDKLLKLRREVLAERSLETEAAPFNAEFWTDRAIAYERLPRGTDGATRGAILRCLQEARRLRPVSHIPSTLLGNFLMRRGEADYEQAFQAYTEAAARYPLAPGLALWQGDALLLQQQPAAAAEYYRKAFLTDMRIIDNNVRLAAAFTDSRAGVFSRHGRETDILLAIKQSLAEMKPEDPRRRDLLLRRMIGLAWLVRQTEPARRKETAAGAVLLRNDLAATADEFAQADAPLAERAHAAYLRAYAYCMCAVNSPELRERAWAQAQALQNEAIRAGLPGTPIFIFPLKP